jgi:phage tail tape-measure protein
MADTQLKIRIDAIDNATKALNDVKKQLEGVGTTTKKLSSSFSILSATIATVVSAATVKAVYDTSKNFQDLRSTLGFVTGSAKSGGNALNFLTQYAKKSTFSVNDLANTFITLYSAGINPTEQLLQTFTDTASATTDQLDTLNDLTRLFAKGIEGGIGLQSLNQLAAKGIPVFRILKEQIGLAREDISKFGESADGSRQILDALQKGLTKTYFGATASRADDLSVSMSRLYKETQIALNIIGENGFSKSLSQATKSLGELVDALEPVFVGLGKLSGFFLEAADGAFKFGTDVAKALKYTIKQEIDDITKATDMMYKNIFGRDRIAKVTTENTVVGKGDIGGINNPIIDVKTSSVLEDILSKFKILSKDTTTIADKIAGGLVKGIESFSQGIAEAIVLGKSLQGTLKAVGQSILVDILKSQISLIAKLLIQLATEKLITQEKIIQASISSGGGGGFLGTLAKIGFNAFAGGGSVPLDAPNLYNPVGEFAEGGAVKGGMPITVGERGREMFIPSSNGTIVPNQDLGGGTNITFNIQANDVRGIRELLIDNRATIINLVNQGANAKGKSNIV